MSKKAHILSIMDDLLQSNTTSNAELMLLYDEIEKLFKEAEDTGRLRRELARVEAEVVQLREIQRAAVEYLRAVSMDTEENCSRQLTKLSTTLGEKLPKAKATIDPNKTMPPGFHDE